MKEWKEAVSNDLTANIVAPATGSKRKAVCPLLKYKKESHIFAMCQDVAVDEVEIRTKYESGTLGKVCLVPDYHV